MGNIQQIQNNNEVCLRIKLIDNVNKSQSTKEIKNFIYQDNKAEETLSHLQYIAQNYFKINEDELKSKYDTEGMVEYYINKNYALAFDIFIRKRNYLMLGVMYCLDRCVNKDYNIAMEYYKHTVALSNSQALVEIGILYYLGRGVDKDYNIAMEYYKHTVALSNSQALVQIDKLYNNL